MAKRKGMTSQGPQTFNQFLNSAKNNQSDVTPTTPTEETRPLATLKNWVDEENKRLKALKAETNISVTSLYNAISGAITISQHQETLILSAAEKLGFKNNDPNPA